MKKKKLLSLLGLTFALSVTTIGCEAFYRCSDGLTVYCEIASQPATWDSAWIANGSVQWDYFKTIITVKMLEDILTQIEAKAHTKIDRPYFN